MPLTEDVTRIAQARPYVAEIYRELSGENVLNVGTQNQVVDFILGDPELSTAVANRAAATEIAEATMAPPRRLSRDALDERVSTYFHEIMERPVIAPAR